MLKSFWFSTIVAFFLFFVVVCHRMHLWYWRNTCCLLLILEPVLVCSDLEQFCSSVNFHNFLSFIADFIFSFFFFLNHYLKVAA